MSQRSTIGKILVDVGRVSEADVATALQYQREHGGYFGEALVACGFVNRAEVEWGLATQFDLPYVFPEADSIDHEAAALVSPEWALAHLALPIMRTADTLTVIVDSPLKTRAIDELSAKTELDVGLALASPATIRELIRQIYARLAAADETIVRSPIPLAELLDAVLDNQSPRFGISVRGAKAWAWWDDGRAIRRRPLAGDWSGDLERALHPGPDESVKGKPRAIWSGRIDHSGAAVPVDVHYLADESGMEYLFHPGDPEDEDSRRFPAPPSSIVSEVRLLTRSGVARFIVTTEPEELGHDIVPHLPELLLDPAWRSIYVSSQYHPAADEAFSQRLPADPDTWASELETLRAFHFDVVTVDLSGGDADWAGSALDVASVAFLLWGEGEDVQPAYEAGVRWHLHVAGDTEGGLEWSLAPLHRST